MVKSSLTVYKDGPSEAWPGPAPRTAKSQQQAAEFAAQYGGATGVEWKASEILQWITPRRHLAVEAKQPEEPYDIAPLCARYSSTGCRI